MALIAKPKAKQKKHGKQKKHASVSATKAKNNGKAHPKKKAAKVAKVVQPAGAKKAVLAERAPAAKYESGKAKKGDIVDVSELTQSELEEIDARDFADDLAVEDAVFGDLGEDEFDDLESNSLYDSLDDPHEDGA